MALAAWSGSGRHRARPGRPQRNSGSAGAPGAEGCVSPSSNPPALNPRRREDTATCSCASRPSSAGRPRIFGWRRRAALSSTTRHRGAAGGSPRQRQHDVEATSNVRRTTRVDVAPLGADADVDARASLAILRTRAARTADSSASRMPTTKRLVALPGSNRSTLLSVTSSPCSDWRDRLDHAPGQWRWRHGVTVPGEQRIVATSA